MSVGKIWHIYWSAGCESQQDVPVGNSPFLSQWCGKLTKFCNREAAYFKFCNILNQTVMSTVLHFVLKWWKRFLSNIISYPRFFFGCEAMFHLSGAVTCHNVQARRAWKTLTKWYSMPCIVQSFVSYLQTSALALLFRGSDHCRHHIPWHGGTVSGATASAFINMVHWSHFHCNVTQFLNIRLPERWSSRGEPTVWPSTTLGLILIDFFYGRCVIENV